MIIRHWKINNKEEHRTAVGEGFAIGYINKRGGWWC